MIEDLQRSQSQNSSQMLLYFYFDFTDSRIKSVENTFAPSYVKYTIRIRVLKSTSTRSILRSAEMTGSLKEV
jgi:hypothetical protein